MKIFEDAAKIHVYSERSMSDITFFSIQQAQMSFKLKNNA